eukprot:CAMPEP_0179029846 /NCGR_PEP_ID=MMETSP0796-20121207/10265_1 /TAXON_ID=73915 /ORGANISM="Pyrodinium bahamense, Strain pbaha01" /LENGTH=47 /DNA_ID= /DNA_START= /DNA_END= /DNA_ORIENTATION=
MKKLRRLVEGRETEHSSGTQQTVPAALPDAGERPTRLPNEDVEAKPE